MAKLYELTAALDGFELQVDEDTGEITNIDELDALQMERDEKVENVALFIKNLLSDAEAYKREKESFLKKQQEAQRKAESLKEYLAFNLKGGEVQKRPGPDQLPQERVREHHRHGRAAGRVQSDGRDRRQESHQAGHERRADHPGGRACGEGGHHNPMIDLREEKTRHILNHYGDAAQLLKALEELTELQAELWKVCKYFKNGEKDFLKGSLLLLNVQNEIADVLVMVGQLKQMFGITDDEIDKFIDFKVSRTLHKIGGVR